MKMNLKPKLPTSEITVLSADEIEIVYHYEVAKYFHLGISFIVVFILLAILGGFSGLLDYLYFKIILGIFWTVPMVYAILESIRSLNNPERNCKAINIKKGLLEMQPLDKRRQLKKVQTPINQHIDFKVNILENRVEVEYFNTIIPLYETASLPILIDGIANMYDFEFYDSTQLLNKTEVLTYKSKRVKEPNFPSLLIIQNRNRNLKIFDLLNQGNWLEFDFQKDEIYRSNSDDTFKIVIGQIQTIEIFTFRGEYSKGKSNIQIKLTLGNGYKLDVFQTKNRKPEQELTTVRDAKAIYKLLKMNYNLKHIEVELKEL
jgi:hypothetical protein